MLVMVHMSAFIFLTIVHSYCRMSKVIDSNIYDHLAIGNKSGTTRTSTSAVQPITTSSTNRIHGQVASKDQSPIEYGVLGPPDYEIIGSTSAGNHPGMGHGNLCLSPPVGIRYEMAEVHQDAPGSNDYEVPIDALRSAKPNEEYSHLKYR